MKIGIVSDSHGKSVRLRRAMEIFIAADADAVVHCGDICSLDDVELLAMGPSGRPQPHLVAGNMDRNRPALLAAARHWNVRYHDEVIEVPIGEGEYLAAVHGHIPSLLSDLIDDEQFPYVCHGHTHDTRDERVGITRVINPGALYDARPLTVAILDTDTDELTFHEVED
ncbi:MAG: metallophosphatase family protein [Planctomycetaceae bacterium]|nr:metallophosphatase family protein [Planctomycetaceae bacterium]